MTRHNYNEIRARIETLTHKAVLLRRHVFRMINPRFCTNTNILNGAGGLRAPGRWNTKGRFPCSYTSCSPETALAEVLHASRRKGLPDESALPRVLVCLDLAVSKALDLTDGSVRRRARISLRQMVEEPWWIENQAGHEALTQATGRAAADAGFEAIIVPSAADPQGGVNIIVFPENLDANSCWSVITPLYRRK